MTTCGTESRVNFENILKLVDKKSDLKSIQELCQAFPSYYKVFVSRKGLSANVCNVQHKKSLWNSTLKLFFVSTYIKSLENTLNTSILTKYITFKLLNCAFTCISNSLKYHNAQTWSTLIKCKITASSSKPDILQLMYCSIKWLFLWYAL